MDSPGAKPAANEPKRAGEERADGLPSSIGRYHVQRVIGAGAMGRVLLAHDPVLDRDVAIKLLRDDLRIPKDVRDGLVVRMRHEARAAARVPHPNLVTLHDMGEDPRVGLYLVFEYVVGPTLKQRAQSSPLSAKEGATLARQLGSALTFAHEAGILHRDIKPENIILAVTGGKLADFGIARIPDSTLTHQGGLMGTPAYSAPETFRGGKFSPESDQFSLAASLYEAIAGQRAFAGDDAVTVATRITAGPPDPMAVSRGLHPDVDRVLSRAMAKEAKDRFASCDAFGRALAAALGYRDPDDAAQEGAPERREIEPETQAEVSTLVAPPPEEKRNSTVAIGAIVVLATLALLVRASMREAETSEVEPASSASASASATVEPAPRPKPSPPIRPTPRASSSAPLFDLEPLRGEPSGNPASAPDEPLDGGAQTDAPNATHDAGP